MHYTCSEPVQERQLRPIMKQSEYHGLLVVDKRAGITSRQVVNHVIHWFPRFTRIGHAGTLDPLATGVLVVCVGMATRLAEYVQRMPKVYRAGILLGSRSDTDDTEGTVQHFDFKDPPPGEARLLEVLQSFVGEIEQIPPAHSAAKIAGRRAYDLARQGKEVVLEPRRIKIHGIELLAYAYPHLDIRVRCGKGTYIRSLARDLGDRLEIGGLIESLRRTSIGPFEETTATRLEATAETARSSLLPVSAAVRDLPRVTIDDDMSHRLRQGQTISLPDHQSVSGSRDQSGELAVFDSGGELVAIALLSPDGQIRPAKVL
jgi:tRNA pseudouridine55 synthase